MIKASRSSRRAGCMSAPKTDGYLHSFIRGKGTFERKSHALLSLEETVHTGATFEYKSHGVLSLEEMARIGASFEQESRRAKCKIRDVRRGNTRIAGTIVLRDFREDIPKSDGTKNNSAKGRLRACKDCIGHLVREHKGEDLTFSKEPNADGQLRWHVRFRVMTDKCLSFDNSWTGEVLWECDF